MPIRDVSELRPGPDELAERRKQLASAAHQLAPQRDRTAAAWSPSGAHSSLLLLRGGPAAATPFRQTNDFYYLTALEVPNAYLTVETATARATVYLPRRSEAIEAGGGPRLCAERVAEVRALTGADEVKPLDELPVDFARRVKRDLQATIFIPLAPAEGSGASRDTVLDPVAEAAVDPWGRAQTVEASVRRALLDQFPSLDVRDASPLLDAMRAIKSPSEIELLREAGRLSALAVLEAMRSTTEGLYEYELGAIAEFVYLRGGAFGSAYEPIVATGKNIWYGHYGAKTSRLEAGELILMDAAPDFRYYTSDIGRMWPVTGNWEPWQLELYEFIVRYHLELLQRIGPGVTSDEVLSGAASAMREVVDRTAFTKPAYERAACAALEFPYHLSHPVGMAVHDVGEYRGRPLEPGHVFSVDPMLWVPEEKLYIRCEDTVVVTADGIENLTALAPLHPEDVVRAMGEPGLLQMAEDGGRASTRQS